MAGPDCRPSESFERLFGKPSLRKAFVWDANKLRMTAYRRDNTVDYVFESGCFSAALQCEEVLTTAGGRAVNVTRLQRTPDGRTVGKVERRTVDGSDVWNYSSTYNARGWLTQLASLNVKTGKYEAAVIYRYPKADAYGNWTAQERYTVSMEFGRPVLGLVGYTTRTVTYRK